VSGFDTALADARQALETARAFLAGGTPVDLAGLDALVAAACGAAKGEPRREAAQALARVAAELDALAAALAARQEQIVRDDAAARRAAVKAYANPVTRS
jgi:hypothetical protein